MEDFVASVVASIISSKMQELTLAGIAAAFNAVPPLVPLVLINGALLAWLVVALVKKWRSRPDSNRRPSV